LEDNAANAMLEVANFVRVPEKLGVQHPLPPAFFINPISVLPIVSAASSFLLLESVTPLFAILPFCLLPPFGAILSIPRFAKLFVPLLV
jgi:hypothetical protein